MREQVSACALTGMPAVPHDDGCRQESDSGQPGSGIVTWATRTGHLAVGDLVPRSAPDTGGLYSTLSLGSTRRQAFWPASSACWVCAAWEKAMQPLNAAHRMYHAC